jgi:hypothetical protein
MASLFCPFLPTHRRFNYGKLSREIDRIQNKDPLYAHYRRMRDDEDDELEEGTWISATQVPSFAPYTCAHVVCSFRAAVDDELSVSTDETVAAIYRDQRWLFVEKADGRTGFVPVECLQLLIPTNDCVPGQ